MSGLIFNDVSKTYQNGFGAVKNLSFETSENEFLVLIGPSGCGKTTVLKMIAGLEDITAGDIILNGKRLNDLSPKQRNIGMVFQNYALYPHMTVYDNIAFPLTIAKESKKDIIKMVQEAAELVELSEFLKSKPKELSGGQRQRTALARAIIRKPEMFLFDEPLSNLDANLRLQMRTELKRIHDRAGILSVYVTHDQLEAMTMGSNIAILKKGEMLQFDSPKNIYTKPANEFIAKFIGNPEINIFPAKYNDGQISFFNSKNISIFAIDVKSKLDLQEDELLKVGIRPEKFLFSRNNADDVELEISFNRKEYLGYESVYYFNIDTQRFAIRSTEDIDIDKQKSHRVYFKTSDVVLFNDKSKYIEILN